MPNHNTRPRYYELCAAWGMMLGCRVEPNPTVLTDYVWRSYAAGEDKGPGEVHKKEGPAWESALHRSGFRVRKGGLERFDYKATLPHNQYMKARLNQARALRGKR